MCGASFSEVTMSCFALLTLPLLIACNSEAPSEAPASTEAPAAQPTAPEPQRAEEAEEVEAGGDWQTFGAPITTEEIIPAAALLADPSKYADKTVRVEGRVADVCQKAGCWMVLTDGDRNMRVLMKDHDFAVARDGAGSLCQVEGVVNAKTVDAREVAHFEEESANQDVIPEKGMEAGAVTYELVASGVQFKSRS